MRTLEVWILRCIVGLIGFGAGVLVAAGVFTVLFIVGLVPRFACKTGTARSEMVYEECIIAGVFAGNVVSMLNVIPDMGNVPYYFHIGGYILLGIYGVFSGIFVGCLALATSEMLDGFPIFSRRLGMKGIPEKMIISIALGKMMGALVYFFFLY